MALSNGYVESTARGKAAEFRHFDTGLLIQYKDHEVIEIACVLAVIPGRKPDQGNWEHDKSVTILLLGAKGFSLDECYLESIG